MPTAEYMKQYRINNPEYRIKENERLKEKLRIRYNEDTEYRERKKKYALDTYYKTKST